MKKLILSFSLALVLVVSYGQNMPNYWVPTSGSANTYSARITTWTGTTYNNKVGFIQFNVQNTGASTVAVNGIAAAPIRKWSGSAWVAVASGDLKVNTTYKISYDNTNAWFMVEGPNLFSSSGSGDLLAANNLSDLASTATARTNLGLGALATVTPGTGVATALGVNTGSSGSFLRDEDLTYTTPEKFGALGDGTTNDAAAIQSAVNSGKSVYFGAKTYLVSTKIDVPANAHFKGSGSLSIIKTTSNIIIFELDSINVSFENLTFQGNDTGTSQTAISASGNSTITKHRYGNTISNCRFYDFGGQAIYGTNILGAGSSSNRGGFYIVNSTFTSNRYGVYWDSQCEYNNVVNCTFTANTTGIKMGAAGNNSFANSNIANNTTGFEITGGSNDAHCVMDACKINHNTTGISINGVGFGYLFSDCMIYSNPISIVNSTRIKFLGCDISTTLITSTSNTQLQFTSNRFYQTPTFTVTGNAPLFFNNTWDSGTLPSILNNTIVGLVTFAPTATDAGIDVGSLAGDPSSLSNGKIWYNSTLNALRAQINGASVSLGSGSLGDFATSVSSSVANEIVLFDGTTGKLGKRSTGTGFAKLTSGVLSTSASVDLASEVGSSILPIANGGTGSTAGAILLSGTSTFSGNVTITGSAPNRLTFNGTATATTTGDALRIFSGSLTGNGTTSTTFYGDKHEVSLTAGANNQTLIGDNYAPTFATGGFTGSAFITANYQGSSTSGSNAAYFRAGGTNNSNNFAFSSIDGAGSTLLAVRSDGVMVHGGTGLGFADISYGTASNSATNYYISHNKTPDAGGASIALRSTATITATTGDRVGFLFARSTWSPTLGAATQKTVRVTETVNQTSTASGQYTGLTVEPVLTSVLGPAVGIEYNATTTSVSGTHLGLKIQDGGVSYMAAISPAQITANQNDYTPTGLNQNYIVRLNTDASRDLTGLAAGQAGELKLIINVGAFDLVLKDENASSTAANRFALNADITLSPDESVQLWYDTTSSRWRAIQN